MRDFLNDFESTIEAAHVRLAQISEVESATAPAEGQWSPKEIVGHLIDSAANNHQRFVRAQLQDSLVFPGYDQEHWVKLQNYREASWNELVELWRLYNRHLIHVMRNASAAVLQAQRREHNLHEIAWKTVAATEPVTLEYFMRDYVDHLKNHLRQIFRDGAA